MEIIEKTNVKISFFYYWFDILYVLGHKIVRNKVDKIYFLIYFGSISLYEL